jgi:hypothetical protein
MADTVGIKFLYTFMVGEYDLSNPGENVISVTSERDGHEKINLTTTPLRETWRSEDVTGWQDVVIEANDTSDAPDTFAILNHNLSNLAVVQIQGSMTSDFSAPAFTLTVSWSKKHMVKLQDVGTAYNYYRFRFLDPANACGYVEVGRIIAGKSFTFSKDEDITDDITITTDDLAYKTKTEGFFRASNQRVKVDKLQVKFNKLLSAPVNAGDTTDNYDGLIDLMDTCGEVYPFLTIPDPEDPQFSVIWGQIDSLPPRMYGVNRYVSFSLTIQEVY